MLFEKRDTNTELNNYKKYIQIMITAGLAMGIFIILFGLRDLFPFGNGSILMIDLHSQYVPLLYRFYDVVTGQKNLFIDFSVSGGAYLYADTVNEVFNPFNYLLLLFGRENIYHSVNILLASYGMAASVTACFCLQKIWPQNRKWNVSISLCYAFSGFVSAQFQIIKWMYPVVLFPLFLVALGRTLDKKKWGVYAFVLAYQLILSLQLGFMTLLFTLFASGFYLSYLKKSRTPSAEEKANRNEAVLALVTGTITSILLSAVVWLPNVLQLFGSTRGGENQSYLTLMKQHGLGDLFERLYQAFHPVLFVMAVCFLWKEWQRKRREKTAFSLELKYLLAWNIFLWVTIIAQPSNLVWHLGSYRCFPVRYAYMVLMSGICAVKYMAVQNNTLEGGDPSPIHRKRNIVIYIVSAITALAALVGTLYWALPISQGFSSLAVSNVPSVVVKVAGILALLTVAGLGAVCACGKKEWMCLLVVCVTGLVYFLFILLPQDYEIRILNEASYVEMNEEYRLSGDLRGLSLYREDNSKWPLNAPLVAGGRSVTGYFPSGSGKEFASAMEKMGYLTPWVSTRSWGGTAISDVLLGIQRNDNEGYVFTNGVLLEQTAQNINTILEEASAGDPLAVQNLLGNALTGTELLEIADMGEMPAENDGSCILTIAEDSIIYLDAGMLPTEFLVWVNNEAVVLPEDGIADSPHRIYTLGKYHAGDVRVKFTDKSGYPLPLSGKKLGVLCCRDWDNIVETIQEQNSAVMTIDEAAGKIKVETDGIQDVRTLVLPIAYTEGWRVSCEQDKDDATAVFGGLLGVEIEETLANNENLEFVFSFVPQGLFAGIVMTVIGMVILIGSYLINRYPMKRMAVENNIIRVGKAAYALFVAVFCVGVFMVYIVPNVGLVVNAVIHVSGKFITDNETEQVVERIAQILETEEGIRVDLVKENLMMKKGVRVSADSLESKDFSVDLVKDGIVYKEGNRWSSENSWENNEHWLQVDFKEERLVTCIKLYWERLNVCKYAIEYSTDKKEWHTAVRFKEPPKEEEQTVLLEMPIRARYLRLFVEDVTKNEEDLSLYYQNISLEEMEVYGEIAASLLIPVPQIEAGTNRKLELPILENGYTLRFGGADYESLIDTDGNIADTISDVETEIGYVLCKDGQEWELPGMKVIIPASEPNENVGNFQVAEAKITDEYSRLADTVSIQLPQIEDDNTELLQKMADLFIDEWGQCRERAGAISDEESVPQIGQITFTLTTEEENCLGKEGYEIQVEEEQITIAANTPAGIRFGCVTLLELVNDAEFGLVARGIYRDYPRYEVRGFGIDAGRRIIPLDMLYRMVEVLSLQKMNTLQIHLNDNQIIRESGYDNTLEGARNLYAGFRLESDIKNADGVGITSDDFYYTKEEFKKLIEDAKVYGVSIVPEIDLPAHSLSLTKVFPELGVTKDPNAADTLDLSKEKARQLAKDIWSEAAPVFENCDVWHIGMDEYYGDVEEFCMFMDELAGHICEIAPEKELRAWGSLTMKGSKELSQKVRDIQLQIWDVAWADPLEMYQQGFEIVNSLKNNLYIIPNSGYDRLDTNYLKNTWKPNEFRTEERTWTLPAWSGKCLGACYMLWNDWSHLNGGEVSDEELLQRFEEPVEVISEKLW